MNERDRATLRLPWTSNLLVRRRKTAGTLVFSRIVFAVALLSLCVGFLSFDALESGKPQDVTSVDTAVVLSGAYDRIDAGLELLQSGRIKYLFISGANPNAGIRIETFEQQFARAHPGVMSFGLCCIALGQLADTTFQNALEVQCWLQEHKPEGPILLVTSTYHMQRAQAALGYVVPEVEITPYSVIDHPLSEGGTFRVRMVQFLKLLATFALLELPVRTLIPTLYGPFQAGCPAEVGQSLP